MGEGGVALVFLQDHLSFAPPVVLGTCIVHAAALLGRFNASVHQGTMGKAAGALEKKTFRTFLSPFKIHRHS